MKATIFSSALYLYSTPFGTYTGRREVGTLIERGDPLVYSSAGDLVMFASYSKGEFRITKSECQLIHWKHMVPDMI